MRDTATVPPGMQSSVRLGLRENWRQFALLVLINAFVGGMVGIERTVVPLIGSEEFGIASTTLIVSFIVSFGVLKAGVGKSGRGSGRPDSAACISPRHRNRWPT